MTAPQQPRIGKMSEAELNEIAKESYRKITKQPKEYEYHSPTAHPPLEQEWIALEEDIQTLTDYFIAAVEQNESKSALRRMWAQEVGVIRSHPRPHPAQQPKEQVRVI